MGSIQRGAIISQNNNGTLERVDGTSTYIGSATLSNGKVITKRFRSHSRDDAEVTERWLAWQSKQESYEEEEADMADKNITAINTSSKAKKCPFGGCDCHPSCALYSDANLACSLKLGMIGLYSINCNYMNLNANESLELIALAIGELKPSPAAVAPKVEIAPKPHVPSIEEGLEAFLDGKTFLTFVNLHGKAVSGMYSKFCKENGYPKMGEKDLLDEVEKRYPELKRRGVRGGSVFEAA